MNSNPLVTHTSQVRTAAELIQQNQQAMNSQSHYQSGVSYTKGENNKLTINLNGVQTHQIRKDMIPTGKGKQSLMARVFNTPGFANDPLPIHPRAPYNQTARLPPSYNTSARADRNSNRSRANNSRANNNRNSAR